MGIEDLSEKSVSDFLSNIFNSSVRSCKKDLFLQLSTNKSNRNKQYNNVVINIVNKRKSSLTECYDYKIIFKYEGEMSGERIVELNEPLISKKNLKLIRGEIKFAKSQKTLFKIVVKDMIYNRIFKLYKGIPDKDEINMKFTDYFFNTQGSKIMRNVKGELILKLGCPDYILYQLFKPVFLRYINAKINDKYVDRFFEVKVNSDNDCKNFIKMCGLVKLCDSEKYKYEYINPLQLGRLHNEHRNRYDNLLQLERFYNLDEYRNKYNKLLKLGSFYSSDKYKCLNISSIELFLDPLCECNHSLSNHFKTKTNLCNLCNKKCPNSKISHPAESIGNFGRSKEKCLETSKEGEKAVLKSLNEKSSINRITISVSLNERFLIKIIEVLSRKDIKYLQIYNNKIFDKKAKAISCLTNLITLEISLNGLGDEEAKIISNLVNLRNLRIGSNFVGDEGAKGISNLANLITLDIGNNFIGDGGAEAISNLVNIVTLYIDNNKIGDEGVKPISNLINLTTLIVVNNNIGDEGAIAIGSKLTNLTTLNISNNEISNEGAKAISNLVKLIYLDVHDNQIGDEGAKAISNLVNLVYLDVHRNQIGDEGFKAISNLFRNSYKK